MKYQRVQEVHTYIDIIIYVIFFTKRVLSICFKNTYGAIRKVYYVFWYIQLEYCHHQLPNEAKAEINYTPPSVRPNRTENTEISVFRYFRFVSVRYFPTIPNRNKIAPIALKRCPSMYFSILTPIGRKVGSELSYLAWFPIGCNLKKLP